MQTMAEILRLTKDFSRALASLFSLEMPIINGLDLLVLRVHMPLQGTLMRINEASYAEIIRMIQRFTQRRAVRRVNDFTRPLVR